MGHGCSAAPQELWGSSHLAFFLWLPRGEKYGFITYRYSEHAALSLKNGPSLRKRNEPSFQLSSGGLGRFFWTRYADLGEEAAAALSLLSAQSCYGAEPWSRRDPKRLQSLQEKAFLGLMELLMAQGGGLRNWGEGKKKLV